MPENVSRSHDVFQKARYDFIKLAHKTEALLKKEKLKLMQQLKRTNVRLAKEKDKLIAAEKRLEEKASIAKKVQVKKIKATIAKEKQLAAQLRESMRPISEKLAEVKDHVVSAHYFDRGMAKIDKEIESYFKKRDAKAAKKSKKKSVKKRSVKSKAIKKKAIKKKAVKKKAIKKKTVKKKASKKAVKKAAS